MMKLKLFQDWLKREGIGLAVLTHSDYNLTYFTGIKPSAGCLSVRPGQATLFLSPLDQKPVLKGITVQKLEQNWGKQQHNVQIKKVGINKSNITLQFYEQLKTIYPRAKFVDIAEGLARLRMIKTKIESIKLAQACQITDNVFRLAVKNLKTMKTEQDLARFIQKKIEEQGAELSFPSIVASGRNSAVPHHITSTTPIGSGFLLLDFGAKHKGYCSDMTRMLYLGKPTKLELQTYNLLLTVQQEIISQIKLNKSLAELNRLARKKLGKYSSYFIHSLGHGVGLEIHEAPKISADSKEKMLKNMFFTIEPGLYFPGQFGIRIEDTVRFDRTVKVLTKSPKKLICV